MEILKNIQTSYFWYNHNRDASSSFKFCKKISSLLFSFYPRVSREKELAFWKRLNFSINYSFSLKCFGLLKIQKKVVGIYWNYLISYSLDCMFLSRHVHDFGWVFLYELSGCGFESSCNQLLFVTASSIYSSSSGMY